MGEKSFEFENSNFERLEIGAETPRDDLGPKFEKEVEGEDEEGEEYTVVIGGGDDKVAHDEDDIEEGEDETDEDGVDATGEL